MPIAVVLVLSLLLLPAGVIGLFRWRSRVRAVRKDGWQPGEAELRRMRWGRVGLTVTFAEHELTAVPTRPVARPVPEVLSRGAVLVGGTGRKLAIVFCAGPFVVAAKRI